MAELLLIEHFKPFVGTIVRFRGTRFALPLDELIADGHRHKSQKREPFSLIFRGPKESEYLPEGFYDCEFEGGTTYNIYVVPIHTADPTRQDYQAVFN
jgi:hypothetical protein